MIFQKFEKALFEESVYPSSKEIYNYIVNKGEIINLRKKDILINYGENDAAVYFVITGIIRGAIINKEGKELTIGFGECGSIIYSTQCYTFNEPSLIQFSACSESMLLKINKPDFEEHLKENHEFCRWFMGTLALALAYRNLRNEGLNGDALNKYKWMMEKRPQIIENVSDKIIASYLDITEVHLSRIKAKLYKEREKAGK